MTHDTIVVAASGPSLTLADAMNASRIGPIMAVNSAVFMIPFAQALYAGDASWWRVHRPFLSWYAGSRYTISPVPCDVQQLPKGPPRSELSEQSVYGVSSGHQAIAAAYFLFRPARIILLGFDCRWDDRKHAHGDHPETFAGRAGCTNPIGTEAWIAGHEALRYSADEHGVRVINASRETALTCYERASLRELIDGKSN